MYPDCEAVKLPVKNATTFFISQRVTLNIF